MAGRPKTREGAYERITLEIRSDLLAKLDAVAGTRREKIEHLLLNSPIYGGKKMASATLTWNNNTGNYEARECGHLIEVDGDVFAEEILRMKREYMEQGLSEEEADAKAHANLDSTLMWMQSTGITGVYIDGVSQED